MSCPDFFPYCPDFLSGITCFVPIFVQKYMVSLCNHHRHRHNTDNSTAQKYQKWSFAILDHLGTFQALLGHFHMTMLKTTKTSSNIFDNERSNERRYYISLDSIHVLKLEVHEWQDEWSVHFHKIFPTKK
jgi:hypothetical protein